MEHWKYNYDYNQMNQILAFSKPNGVDMPLNEFSVATIFQSLFQLFFYDFNIKHSIPKIQLFQLLLIIPFNCVLLFIYQKWK